MTALDMHASLDRQLSEVKNAYEAERKALQDQLFVAQAETALHKGLAAKAATDRDMWMRVATQYTTQFSLVEKVFSDVKASALAIASSSESPEATQSQAASLSAEAGTTQSTLLPLVPPYR